MCVCLVLENSLICATQLQRRDAERELRLHPCSKGRGYKGTGGNRPQTLGRIRSNPRSIKLLIILIFAPPPLYIFRSSYGPAAAIVGFRNVIDDHINNCAAMYVM